MFKIPKNCVIPVIGVGNLETKQLDYHWLDESSIEWLTNVIREAYEKERLTNVIREEYEKERKGEDLVE